MQKKIETLTEDIYHVLNSDHDHESDATLVERYSSNIGNELSGATKLRNEPRAVGKLWASDLGKPCLRQAHYNFNGDGTEEKLDGHTKFKFLYGNLLEEAVLYLAEEAGHTVESAQARVEYPATDKWIVSGRIDGVIDGTLMDVKSTSTYGFKRYKDGITPYNDSFGYLYQLGFYKEFGGFDVKDEAGFLWIDKGNGHIKYTPCTTPTKEEIEKRTKDIIEAIETPIATDVPKYYSPAPYGKSGNYSLPMSCSYCKHKQRCWEDANGGQGLRGFLYNQGPVWFTDIQRTPNVPELGDRDE
jgi:hypothetical protein